MSSKRCTVAFALPARQLLWTLEVSADATVADVLEQAQRAAQERGDGQEVPWDSHSLGIFGEPCGRDAIPLDGDRVEIYRTLINDPRASRRARVR